MFVCLLCQMISTIMKREDCSTWKQAGHSVGKHQSLLSLVYSRVIWPEPAWYGAKKKDLHLEEEDYILNNLILKNFLHAESLCLLYLLLSPKCDF